MDGKRPLSPDKKFKRVGYWMTDKKIRRLNFEAFERLCRLVCRCCNVASLSTSQSTPIRLAAFLSANLLVYLIIFIQSVIQSGPKSLLQRRFGTASFDGCTTIVINFSVAK
jgi:Inositol 1,3,4-trisphosphate 5/6-kinase pre-ATP-grasp domain